LQFFGQTFLFLIWLRYYIAHLKNKSPSFGFSFSKSEGGNKILMDCVLLSKRKNKRKKRKKGRKILEVERAATTTTTEMG